VRGEGISGNLCSPEWRSGQSVVRSPAQNTSCRGAVWHTLKLEKAANESWYG
jgi:hypothetical protein